MRSLFCGAALVITLSASAAEAATYTIYTDRAAFLAAAGSVSVETFNSTSPRSLENASYDFGAFTLTDQRTSITGGETYFGPQRYMASLNGTNFVQTLGYDAPGAGRVGLARLTFDAPVAAFGADFASGAAGFVQLRIGGETFTRQAGADRFIGVIADTRFGAVEITAPRDSGTYVGFDNVTFSTAAVPEPASWALMIGGFGLAGTAARRRSHPGTTRHLA